MVLGLGLTTALTPGLVASENVPHRPFAQWAELPAAGQFVAGLVYEESESYRIWAKRDEHNITVKADGESYGLDINQGYLSLQYGIKEKWAADLSLGYSSMGWRSFSPNNEVESTSGLSDISLGIRYQVFNEATADSCWLPTLTLRAGGVLPGT